MIAALKEDEHADVRKIMLGQEFVESLHGRERSVRTSEISESVREQSSFVSVMPDGLSFDSGDLAFQNAFDEISENNLDTNSQSPTE